MKLPGWLTPWRKQTDLNAVTPIRAPYRTPSKFGFIVEAFGGAWQQNLSVNSTQDLLAFSAVFACVSLRARDIAKLRARILRRTDDNIWAEDNNSAFAKILRKPNRYQTWLQFIQQWMISKLVWGNTYILKERDGRTMVRAMYVLNPDSVTPLVAPDGEVYYQLNSDRLAGILQGLPAVPASEIIHDRGECLFHPLVGVSPLYAAALAATQGNRIQGDSQRFFENRSLPSGQLTAPGQISEEAAARVKAHFEQNFSGQNAGRLFVSGDGLKFEPFTIPAEEAQLIEQLKWTGEDVARAFLVPAYKIGLGAPPALGHVSAVNQEYYQQTLQLDIEAIEALLDDGLQLPPDQCVEFDLDLLLRMDQKTRAETNEIRLKSGVLAPNEARRADNLGPVPGGEYPYMQQQNYSLEALARRDAREDPFSPLKPVVPPKPESPEDNPADDEDQIDEEAAAKALEAFA